VLKESVSFVAEQVGGGNVYEHAFTDNARSLYRELHIFTHKRRNTSPYKQK
jgi:hypothetical protein